MRPIEYLAAATVVAVRRRSGVGALPQSRDELKALVENTFAISLSDDVFSDLIANLRAASLLRVIHDEYAGEIFTVLKTKMDRPAGELSQLLIKAEWGGNSLLNRVFANQHYWDNLSKDAEYDYDRANEPESADTPIPASDRVVTLTHNQAVEIEEKAEEIISAISGYNQIDGEPYLRELVLGQLKAGRELIKVGTFKIYALESTLIEGLRFVAKRYEREGVAALAAALVVIVLKHIGIDA